MIKVRKSDDRGYADHGWLKTFHSFSFASYLDPEHTKFRSLRVINEDWIARGRGFGTHPHENMEIITYIIEGQLEHRDSMGNGSVIHAGELQRMTAGIGVTHSEHNPSEADTHLLQIWIYPETINLQPGYEQQDFSDRRIPNRWVRLASRDAKDNSLTVHQDVEMLEARLEAGHRLDYAVEPERHLWVQMIKGRLSVNGTDLEAGDGAALSEEKGADFLAVEDSVFILFDLA